MRIDLNISSNGSSNFSLSALQNMSPQTVRRLGLLCLATVATVGVTVLLIGRLRRIEPTENQIWLNRLLAAFGNPRAQLHTANLSLQAANKQWERTLLALANKGDREACYQLARKYDNGDDVEQNDARALEFYAQAAAVNHPKALFDLGCIYENGQNGVEADEQRAGEYYERAANLGYAPAQFNLGNFYRDGWGDTPPNLRRAEALWLQAANQNHASAQGNLGWLYANEEFDGYNLVEARRWNERGAANGDALSNYKMGLYSEESNDHELAKSYYKSAADLGDDDAQFSYAKYMEEGEEYETAHKYYVMAQNQDHPDAQLALSRLSKHGIWVNQDNDWAITYLERAIDNGSEHAGYKLAKIYYYGQLGQEKDVGAAVEYVSFAANGNHPKAKALLKQMLPEYKTFVDKPSATEEGSDDSGSESSSANSSDYD